MVFWVYPLLFSFILSFCDYDAFHHALFSFVGFENYLRLLSDQTFIRAFVNTLAFVAVTTPLTTLFALALAILLNACLRLEQLFRSIFFMPAIISIVVTATIFKSFYSPIGMLNRLLGLFSIPAQAWLIETHLALPSIMLMNIWAFTGYYMVLYLAALKSVPEQYYEAAQVDGATEWQQFRFITLPHISYMTKFILVINTIRSWQIFPEVYTLTGGGPVGTTNTLVHHLYETAFKYHEMGYASAMSYFLLALILILSVIQMKLLSRKQF